MQDSKGLVQDLARMGRDAAFRSLMGEAGCRSVGLGETPEPVVETYPTPCNEAWLEAQDGD